MDSAAAALLGMGLAAAGFAGAGVGIAIRNLLSYERTFTQGRYIVEQFDPGTDISVGIRYSN